MQVYLPQDLYRAVKKQRLPASELLQEAVRAEMKRRKLRDATEQYLAELTAEVGEPTPQQRARAAALASRIATHLKRKAG